MLRATVYTTTFLRTQNSTPHRNYIRTEFKQAHRSSARAQCAKQHNTMIELCLSVAPRSGLYSNVRNINITASHDTSWMADWQRNITYEIMNAGMETISVYMQAGKR